MNCIGVQEMFFIRRHTIIKGYKDLWQIDLAEVQQYADEYDGYRYILVCITCYSKYVHTRAIKNKTGIEVTNAMKMHQIICKVTREKNFIIVIFKH